jgi:hypothetical protein
MRYWGILACGNIIIVFIFAATIRVAGFTVTAIWTFETHFLKVAVPLKRRGTASQIRNRGRLWRRVPVLQSGRFGTGNRTSDIIRTGDSLGLTTDFNVVAKMKIPPLPRIEPQPLSS